MRYLCKILCQALGHALSGRILSDEIGVCGLKVLEALKEGVIIFICNYRFAEDIITPVMVSDDRADRIYFLRYREVIFTFDKGSCKLIEMLLLGC
jgi:hypothetical protein